MIEKQTASEKSDGLATPISEFVHSTPASSANDSPSISSLDADQPMPPGCLSEQGEVDQESERSPAAPVQLVPLSDVHQHLKHLFPSKASIEWEYRSHKREYIEGSSIFLIAGRLLVDIRRFEEIALRRGLANAARSAGTNVGIVPPTRSMAFSKWENTQLTAMDIAAAAIRFEGYAGVYFLLSGNKVIYVGQSKNIFARVNDHKNAGVAFDRWHFVPCRADMLLDIEKHYITILNPTLNRVRNGRAA